MSERRVVVLLMVMLALVVRASIKRNKKERDLAKFGMGYPVVLIEEVR
ncbi:hypothetical protein [Abyssogena phaseoliformis symbiont]|nr:hypothetical protein [Abyssogena phaseoliformis symbiont]